MLRTLARIGLFYSLSIVPLLAADAPARSTPAAATVNAIAVDAMKRDMAYLTSEELQGRNTGSPEIEKAADYIAAQFKAAGLEPAGKDGSYFQPYTFTYSRAGGRVIPPVGMAFDVNGKEIKLKYVEGFKPVGIPASGKTSGEVVFAGYGITSKDPAYDDYAGIDVKGKIVIILRRAPNWDKKENPFQTEENANLAALLDKVELAGKNGAAAVIFVNDRTLGAESDDLLEQRRDLANNAAKIPVLHIKRMVLDNLLATGGMKLAEIEDAIDKNLKPHSFVVKGAKATLEVTLSTPLFHAKNVVGTLPGAGPLADEVVVLGAHFDHVGHNEFDNSTAGPSVRGKIHPGADDNASGTCGLMELARRYGAMKNRQGRRLVFVAFSGEELGLYGSKAYANNPAFPNEKTAFMLNMDMIGRSKELDDNGKMKDRLVIYGHGTGEGLEKLVDAANAKFDFKLFKVPGGTGPSDHDSFYKKKIPVLFFFTGTHKDYHTPTDTADKINYTVMAKVVDMVEMFTDHFTTTLDRPKYLLVKGGWEDPTDDAPKRSGRAGLPKLGITPGNYGEADKGVLVDDLAPGGAAEKAGIKPGDFIISIAGKEVKNMDNYMTVLSTQKAGTEIEIVVKRNKEDVKLKITPTAAR